MCVGYPLINGCHACARAGFAIFTWNFDAGENSLALIQGMTPAPLTGPTRLQRSEAENVPRRKFCGSRTCKPNSVRRIAPAGRSFLWAAHYWAAQATYPEVVARRAGTRLGRTPRLPPYLVLLRVGFALPVALLRRRCALTAPFHPYLGVAAGAVYFLWHFPSTGLEPSLPDVIRHTALRSSDFPPVTTYATRATVRSSCQLVHCNSRWSVISQWSVASGQRFVSRS